MFSDGELLLRAVEVGPGMVRDDLLRGLSSRFGVRVVESAFVNTAAYVAQHAGSETALSFRLAYAWKFLAAASEIFGEGK